MRRGAGWPLSATGAADNGRLIEASAARQLRRKYCIDGGLLVGFLLIIAGMLAPAPRRRNGQWDCCKISLGRLVICIKPAFDNFICRFDGFHNCRQWCGVQDDIQAEAARRQAAINNNGDPWPMKRSFCSLASVALLAAGVSACSGGSSTSSSAAPSTLLAQV